MSWQHRITFNACSVKQTCEGFVVVNEKWPGHTECVMRCALCLCPPDANWEPECGWGNGVHTNRENGRIHIGRVKRFRLCSNIASAGLKHCRRHLHRPLGAQRIRWEPGRTRSEKALETFPALMGRFLWFESMIQLDNGRQGYSSSGRRHAAGTAE